MRNRGKRRAVVFRGCDSPLRGNPDQGSRHHQGTLDQVYMLEKLPQLFSSIQANTINLLTHSNEQYHTDRSHLHRLCKFLKMPSLVSLATLVGYLATHTSALSLPPLIPAIPGVTEPLAENAPPLPILQVPTPPLDSPPFAVSNIKPKKIGYFWTGAGDNKHKDFLATVSLDDVRI